ncbi:MAG: hypothetical protein AB1513_01280 [Pseudomonadota bacterium]
MKKVLAGIVVAVVGVSGSAFAASDVSLVQPSAKIRVADFVNGIGSGNNVREISRDEFGARATLSPAQEIGGSKGITMTCQVNAEGKNTGNCIGKELLISTRR